MIEASESKRSESPGRDIALASYGRLARSLHRLTHLANVLGCSARNGRLLLGFRVGPIVAMIDITHLSNAVVVI